MTEKITASPLESDFSLVIGGPLYQALRRAHLSGDALQLTRRRIAVLASVAWIPLFVLSVLDGKAWGDAVAVPFLHDIDAHLRFLVALPLLVLAEIVVHQRMRPVVGQFVTLGLVPDAIRDRFDAAIASAMRLRNSVLAELRRFFKRDVQGALLRRSLNPFNWYKFIGGSAERSELAAEYCDEILLEDATFRDLLDRSGVPIDRSSFETVELMKERDYFLNLPTSFVLKPEEVDRLRELAGRLLRQAAEYQRIVRDMGEPPAK